MKRDWAWKAFSFSCSKRKKQSRDLGEQSKARSCSLLEIRAEMRSFNNKSSFGKQEKDDKKVLTTHCTSVFKCSPGQGELHSPWQPRSQDKFPSSYFYVSVTSLQHSLTFTLPQSHSLPYLWAERSQPHNPAPFLGVSSPKQFCHQLFSSNHSACKVFFTTYCIPSPGWRQGDQPFIAPTSKQHRTNPDQDSFQPFLPSSPLKCFLLISIKLHQGFSLEILYGSFPLCEGTALNKRTF